MFIFSIIYMFLDDSHFSGVNKFKETLQEEVLKKEAKDKIKENFENEYNELLIEHITRETKQEAKKRINFE